MTDYCMHLSVSLKCFSPMHELLRVRNLKYSNITSRVNSTGQFFL